MADRADVLLHLYSEERAEARQSEDQRATLTNLILVVVAAGLAFVTSRQGDNEAALIVSLAILALGIYGAVATAKYFERWLRHWRRSYAFQVQLFELYPEIDASLASFHYAPLRLRTDPYEQEIERRFPRLSKVKLYRLWIAFHCAVAIAGAIMAAIFLALSLG